MTRARVWTLVAVALVVAALVGGCVKKNPPPTDTTPTVNGSTTPPTTSTPVVTTPNGSGNTTPVSSPPPVKDSGSIQGPFEKSWPIAVPALSPQGMVVLFNLTGQQGAPATAQVYLVLSDPAGKAIKSATVGLGGDPKEAWTFSASQITSVGTYTLKATAQPPPAPIPTGLPSGGVADYQLYAAVTY